MFSLIINTWKILENKQRFKSIIFFGLVSFSIILELLGIGMVFPIIGLIINENFLSTLPFLKDTFLIDVKHETLISISLLSLFRMIFYINFDYY